MSEKGSRPKDKGVFERPPSSGIWWVRYKDEHGREHREQIGKRALAVKVYQKRKTEIAERRFFPERIRRKDILLKDAITSYQAKHVVGRLRNAKHLARYGQMWASALGKRTLRAIVPSDVAAVVKRRQADGLSHASINRELAFLRRVFNVAIGDGEADTNPVGGLRGVKLFREDNARVRYVTEEEEIRLHQAIGTEHWPLVLFALHTGFRRGNQFRLPWTDIDFDTGTIRAAKSKSGRSYHVPMNDTLRATLRALPSRLRSPYVFPSTTGETPLDSQNFMNRVFLPALKKAKIADFHWHDLRHTFASRLVMAGVDISTVQALMGHETLAMTARYAHLSPGHMLEAVRRLMGPGAGPRSGTRSGTEERGEKAVASGGAEVVELPADSSGGARSRTADLGIMRPSL